MIVGITFPDPEKVKVLQRLFRVRPLYIHFHQKVIRKEIFQSEIFPYKAGLKQREAVLN